MSVRGKNRASDILILEKRDAQGEMYFYTAYQKTEVSEDFCFLIQKIISISWTQSEARQYTAVLCLTQNNGAEADRKPVLLHLVSSFCG